MDIASLVHLIVVVVAFLAGAYVVFVVSQQAAGVLKPIGMLLAVLLAVSAALFVAGHAMGKMGDHDAGPKPATAATTSDAPKPDGGK